MPASRKAGPKCNKIPCTDTGLTESLILIVASFKTFGELPARAQKFISLEIGNNENHGMITI